MNSLRSIAAYGSSQIYLSVMSANAAKTNKNDGRLGQAAQIASGNQWKPNSRDSQMFRATIHMSSTAPHHRTFADFIDAIGIVSACTECTDLLDVGVSHCEEPLSFLAAFNSIARSRDKSLEEVVDLHMVDFGPQLHADEIQSTVDKSWLQYSIGESSLIQHSLMLASSGDHYTVKPHIIDYLLKAANDPDRSHWNTDVKDFAELNKEKQRYDLISYNNVHMYVQGPKRDQVIPDLVSMLRVNGVIILDDDFYFHLTLNDKYQSLAERYQLKQLHRGIFQRLA